MPVDRGSLFTDTATLVGPSATGGDDGYGTLIEGAATDVTLATGVKIGLFPKSAQTDWIRDIGGGPANLRDWSVAVSVTQPVVTGCAFVVASGRNPGRYRVKQITQGPKGTTLILCLCNKES